MRLRHYPPGALFALAALGWAAALGPASARAAEEVRVLIRDFAYMPLSLTVKAGTTVTWVNMDDEPHNVISDEGLFRSGGFDSNESFSYKFDKPGTYRITCSLHPRMLETVVVERAL